MMANPTLIQKQIKENTEDLHNFVRDLKLWEDEMKRKDRKLSNEPSEEDLPPVRKPKFSDKPKTVKDEKNEKKRIKSNDYKAWEQFDVDKACEDIDNEEENNIEDEKEELPLEDEKYLKEKALYEKELGNQHWKNGKWDEAIDCYTRAITTYSKDPVFFANRAQCYLVKKEYSRVEQDCTQSLKLDSTYVKAYMRRATAREALGFYNDARSDLTKVLQLEPNNSQAMRQLAKVKSATSRGKEVKKKETFEGKLDAEPKPKTSPKQTTSIKPTENLPSTSTSNHIVSNNVDVKQEKFVNELYEPKWNHCDNIVEPINKPPHLRSKKPLKRVEIHDVGLNVPKHICARKLAETKDLPTSSMTPDRVSLTSNTESKPRSVHTLPSVVTSVPPPPKTSVQFHLAWSSIKDNKTLCYQFLKQIPGEELPDVFKDSLESKMLSSVLQVLASEFTAAHESVLPYLRGLSRVRRFSTLALFLSLQDKSCLSSLFDYCSNRSECPSEELIQLKKVYELS